MKDLDTLSYDPEFEPGARNAVFTCLAVRPGERAVLITDDACLSIGAALLRQLREAQAEVSAFVLEEHVQRPHHGAAAAHRRCPGAGGRLRLRRPRSAGRASQPGGHDRHRQPAPHPPRAHGEHHPAHHGGGDARRLQARGRPLRWVLERVRPARTMTASSPAGTRLTATFSAGDPLDPHLRDHPPGEVGNLPGGEVFTSPPAWTASSWWTGYWANWLANKYGRMTEHPLRIEIEDSRIVDLACPRQDIVDDFRPTPPPMPTATGWESWRWERNLALHDCIGQILQDEKLPGLHLAFGHPYAEHTGANWSSTTHVDVVGRHFDIAFDGVPIMRDSRFLVDADAARPVDGSCTPADLQPELPRRGLPADVRAQ
jgi:hypothetical protein